MLRLSEYLETAHQEHEKFLENLYKLILDRQTIEYEDCIVGKYEMKSKTADPNTDFGTFVFCSSSHEQCYLLSEYPSETKNIQILSKTQWFIKTPRDFDTYWKSTFSDEI